jgi:tRNA(Arg) A34 adenosine deaminase TadA
MCAGAICRVRVPKVVYGCSGQGLRDLIGGGLAVPCRQILQRPHHMIEVLGPLLEEEGLALHRKLNWWGTRA